MKTKFKALNDSIESVESFNPVHNFTEEQAVEQFQEITFELRKEADTIADEYRKMVAGLQKIAASKDVPYSEKKEFNYEIAENILKELGL